MNLHLLAYRKPFQRAVRPKAFPAPHRSSYNSALPQSKQASSVVGSPLLSRWTAVVSYARSKFLVTAQDSFEGEDYGELTALDIVKKRTGWLAVFCVGLVFAAGVVRDFDDLIAHHVELSFFVPLIMGHGGNSGSQSTCAVIRGLALRQISFRNLAQTVAKEALAGAIMGTALGSCVFLLSLATHAISPDVGLVVAISMPVVSVWSNGLGAFLSLSSAKLHLDPAMTSAPLMTTIVDTTGLWIYFLIAKAIIGH